MSFTSANAVKMGKAYVEVGMNMTNLEKGLSRAQTRLKNFASVAGKIGGVFAGLGVTMAGAFVPAIQAASDMQETMGKFSVVFGSNSKAVKEWADQFASEVGRSKRQVADFLASSQDLFVPLGFDQSEAENLSKQLTKLAVDLGSFNNRADADVLQDLHAALTGSSETVKRYGIIVNEAAIKQEMLNRGLDPSKATEAQKVMSRFNIIMAGSTAAQGDAIRTAGSYANQMKALNAAFEDTKVAIGEAVLPEVTKFVAMVKENVTEVSKWAEVNEQSIRTFGKLAIGIGAVGGTLLALNTAANVTASVIGNVNGVLKVMNGRWGYLKTLGIAAIFYGIARATYAAQQSVKDFNASLEETQALTNRLATMDAERLQKTLSEADLISDPNARKKFLQEKLKAAETNLAGASRNVDSNKATLNKVQDSFLNRAVDTVYGSANIQEAQSNLSDSITKRDSLRAEVDALRKALQEGTAPIAEAVKETRRQRSISNASGPTGALSSLFAGLHHKAKGTSGVDISQALAGFQVAPSLLGNALGRVQQAQASGSQAVASTMHRINSAQAMDAGTGEAQRAIAQALSPRVKVEEKMAKDAEETKKATQNSARHLESLVQAAQRGTLILAGGAS
ncbi:MAG: phage tail tape measure protein [Planctomycetaceae bacterium]|nr:phage tail tape measure protein [Planctomycetaceae bacterium]